MFPLGFRGGLVTVDWALFVYWLQRSAVWGVSGSTGWRFLFQWLSRCDSRSLRPVKTKVEVLSDGKLHCSGLGVLPWGIGVVCVWWWRAYVVLLGVGDRPSTTKFTQTRRHEVVTRVYHAVLGVFSMLSASELYGGLCCDWLCPRWCG